ncbi:unnamed protein product [Cuscuta epithymum]|uniref:Uncharacterized protein n=1 Tax=Cuscuta epithymum TaxID=186058 RepID=A0AAV0DFB5_9ASTE|nr:unnamed protein product [Cuscuta epithymum]
MHYSNVLCAIDEEARGTWFSSLRWRSWSIDMKLLPNQISVSEYLKLFLPASINGISAGFRIFFTQPVESFTVIFLIIIGGKQIYSIKSAWRIIPTPQCLPGCLSTFRHFSMSFSLLRTSHFDLFLSRSPSFRSLVSAIEESGVRFNTSSGYETLETY